MRGGRDGGGELESWGCRFGPQPLQLEAHGKSGYTSVKSNFQCHHQLTTRRCVRKSVDSTPLHPAVLPPVPPLRFSDVEHPIHWFYSDGQADKAYWHKPDTMLGSPRYGTALGFTVLLNALLLATQAAEGVLTDHFLVQLHEDAQDEAHQVATQHGFQSARKVGMLWLKKHHAILAATVFLFLFFLS